MSDYDNQNENGDITGLLASIKTITDVNLDSDDKTIQKMTQLLEKAHKTIEELREQIRKQDSEKLPTKDEVESMSAMLDALNKLDIKTLDRLSEWGDKDK